MGLSKEGGPKVVCLFVCLLQMRELIACLYAYENELMTLKGAGAAGGMSQWRQGGGVGRPRG